MNFEKTNKYIEQILAVVVIIVPFIIIPFDKNGDYFYNPKAIALHIISCIFMLLLFANRKQLGQYLEWDRINKVLFIYFILITISLFFASDLGEAINGSFMREEGYIMLIIYMILFLAARTANNMGKRLYIGMLTTACILSVYGILQHYGIDPIPRDYIRTNWIGWTFATFGNPNFMGSYLVLMLPFSMYLYIIDKKRVGSIAFSLILLCLLCTNTRGSWIGGFAAVGSFIFICWFLRDKYKGTAKRIVVLMVIAVIIIIGFNLISGNAVFARFNSIFEDGFAETAGSYRLFIWIRVVQLIAMKPWFGFGISNLQIPFTEFFNDDTLETFGTYMIIDKAHNEYLNIAVSSGIPSLIAYLGFVALIVRKGMARLEKEPVIWPIMAAVIGYLVQALFNISVVSVAYIFWVMLGFLAGKSLLSTDGVEQKMK